MDDLTHGRQVPDIVDIVQNTDSKSMLEIAVSDTGVGIKSEDLSKLFKLFGFIENSRQLNTRGVGLGLHICRMIC